MKRTELTALVLALVLLLSLCACGGTGSSDGENAAPLGESVKLTDMVGRELSIIPGGYERVVCIGAGALRLYSYVGDMALLCGVEDIDNTTLAERPRMLDGVARPYILAYGEGLTALPSCGVGGPNAQTAEAEKILSCEPDIVISAYEDADKANALQEQLGVPVVTLRIGPDSVYDPAFAESVALLGKVFGKEERARELNAFIARERAEIEGRTADIAEADKPSVYICGLGNWGTTNHLMTVENYIIFDIAHVRNAVTGLQSKGIGPIEEEKFAALGEDVDIMFMDAAAVKNIQPLYAEDPTLLDSCRAWREGEVYLEMAYNAYYTNFELALLNTWFIAKTVYPERFDDIDMTEKTNEVTEVFLGMPLAEEIFACPASYGGYGKIDTRGFFAS